MKKTIVIAACVVVIAVISQMELDGGRVTRKTTASGTVAYNAPKAAQPGHIAPTPDEGGGMCTGENCPMRTKAKPVTAQETQQQALQEQLKTQQEQMQTQQKQMELLQQQLNALATQQASQPQAGPQEPVSEIK